ncbi:MAG TPA: tetratricopeptide repeat protein [Sedimentisphaerales bacterium]|nr:tetratricopeptide repeat protein [Sedimentisphaerales bacterium]
MMPESDAHRQSQSKGHFERARQASEAGDLDRAVEAYLDGLRLAPDDVAEGHIELRVLALQRQERGGSKPSADEVARRLESTGAPLDRMLNAEYLLAMDPEHLPYGEALLHAAVDGGYRDAAKWIADLVFLANNNSTRPSADLYVDLRNAYAAIGQLDRAAAACQRAIRLKPQDKQLVDDLRRLRSRLNLGSKTSKSAGAASKPVPHRKRIKEEEKPTAETVAPSERHEAAMVQISNEQQMAEAKAFFANARKAADGKQYDYAIDMYLSGLARAPDALEEGHLPLCELGLQRRGKGGKKPSMMEKVKRMRAKSPLEQMLNAEYLFVKDPDNLAYAEAMLKAAVDGGFSRTAHWIANLIFQTNNALEKPSLQTYLLLKDSYKALGQYDKAVAACQRAYRMKSESKELADEFKNLSAELTMSKGNYNGHGDFRQSIRDQETQAKLYAKDRVIKTEDYRISAVEDARKAYAREPELAKNVFTLAETLADLENDKAENEAVQLLEDTYVRSREFAFKERAGLLRLRQLRRKLREAKKQFEARPDSTEGKERVADLTATLNDAETEHYRLCVENYPTDLAHKYEYALRLMRNGRYNDAIPLFQEAHKDPRRRISAMDKVGYCFFMKGWYADAIDVFRQAIDTYEIKDDAVAKELRYNLARAYEEQGEKDKALDIYRRIAQLDFCYRDVGARVDRLRAGPDKAGPSANSD